MRYRERSPLYHVAPRHCRASIERHGLDSSRDTIPGLAGTYLWATIEQAAGYAAPFGDDIWIIECAGIPLDFGPYSIDPGERWTPTTIPRDRVLGRLAGTTIWTPHGAETSLAA